MIVAATLVAQGITSLLVSGGVPEWTGRKWLVLSAVVSIVAGLLVLFDLPSSAGWTLGTIVGAVLLLQGISLTLLGLEVRRAAPRLGPAPLVLRRGVAGAPRDPRCARPRQNDAATMRLPSGLKAHSAPRCRRSGTSPAARLSAHPRRAQTCRGRPSRPASVRAERGAGDGAVVTGEGDERAHLSWRPRRAPSCPAMR